MSNSRRARGGVAAVAVALLVGACGGSPAGSSGSAQPVTSSTNGSAATSPGPSPSALPAEAVLDCSVPGVTDALTPVVRASPDGVHVRVMRTAVDPVLIEIESGITADPVSVGPDGDRYVLTVPPGRTKLRCRDSADTSDEGPPWSELRVEDPEGVFVDAGLECPTSEQVWSGDTYGQEPEGEPGDPEDLARVAFGEVAASTFVTAGYPEAEPRLVARQENGRTVELLQYSSDGHGGWYVASQGMCRTGLP